MEIAHVYTRKRSEFGRHCNFSDCPAKVCVDIQPDPSLADNFVLRNPVDACVQHGSEMSEHEVSGPRPSKAAVLCGAGFVVPVSPFLLGVFSGSGLSLPAGQHGAGGSGEPRCEPRGGRLAQGYQPPGAGADLALPQESGERGELRQHHHTPRGGEAVPIPHPPPPPAAPGGQRDLTVLCPQLMEHCVKQNNAIDIYEEYFREEEADEFEDEAPSAKTINVIRSNHRPLPKTHSHSHPHPQCLSSSAAPWQAAKN